MGDSAPIMISTSYAMPAKRFISQGEMSVSFLGGFSAPVGARSETARPPILAGSTLCAPREKLEGREARGGGSGVTKLRKSAANSLKSLSRINLCAEARRSGPRGQF